MPAQILSQLGADGTFLHLPQLISLHCLIYHAPDGVRRLPLHPLGGVGVGIQREPCAVVPQHTGHRLYIHPVEQGCGRKRMPLWHNKDKPENPCGATG